MSAGCPGGGLMSTILSYNPIAYWPLNELSGLTAINYGSLGAAANGTHTEVTLDSIDAPGGTRAPYYNGANAYTNIYSVALSAAFSGNLFSAVIFYRPYSGAVWTDGTEDKLFSMYIDGTNLLYIRKSSINNQLDYRVTWNGTGTIRSKASVSTTDWTMLSIVVNGTAAQAYYNGASEGAGWVVGVLASALGATGTIIGAQNKSITPQYPTYGYLAHTAIFSAAFSLADIQAIYAARGI
jgi:hypothetical protein